MEKSLLYPQRKIRNESCRWKLMPLQEKQPETSRTNRRTRKMIVNRGWQESTTTKEEMQAVNRNINEQKKQTIETLRQTIKQWDIISMKIQRKQYRRRLNGCRLQKQANGSVLKVGGCRRKNMISCE